MLDGRHAVREVEDLKLWERADQFWVSVAKILERPGIRQHRKLHEQLSDAADSILSNIAEGFEQPSDRAFAKYLYTAKGSTAEVVTRLKLCCRRGYVTEEEFAAHDALGEEIARIANGLISICSSPTGATAAWAATQRGDPQGPVLDRHDDDLRRLTGDYD